MEDGGGGEGGLTGSPGCLRFFENEFQTFLRPI